MHQSDAPPATDALQVQELRSEVSRLQETIAAQREAFERREKELAVATEQTVAASAGEVRQLAATIVSLREALERSQKDVEARADTAASTAASELGQVRE